MFTSRIYKLHENGLLVRWKNIHWPWDECAYYRAQNKTSSRALDLKDVRAAFAILGIGMGTATVILVIECIISLMSPLLKLVKKRWPPHGASSFLIHRVRSDEFLDPLLLWKKMTVNKYKVEPFCPEVKDNCLCSQCSVLVHINI